MVRLSAFSFSLNKLDREDRQVNVIIEEETTSKVYIKCVGKKLNCHRLKKVEDTIQRLCITWIKNRQMDSPVRTPTFCLFAIYAGPLQFYQKASLMIQFLEASNDCICKSGAFSKLSK